MTLKIFSSLLLSIVLVFLWGCANAGSDDAHDHDHEHDRSSHEHERTITNRIDVPPTVRRNLGITFARVERRHVASTIRVPGQFETAPRARREYHTTLSGRIELLVNQYESVEAGTPLYRIDSPQWREMQQKLNETIIAIQQAAQRSEGLKARKIAVDKRADRLQDQEKLWMDRIAQLEKLIAAGGGAASDLTEARSQLISTRTSLAEVEEEQVEIAQQQNQIEAELAGYRQAMPLLYVDALGEQVASANGSSAPIDLALTPAAAMLGVPVNELRRNVSSSENPIPYWRTIDQIEIRAHQPGIVETIAVTNGAWVDSSALVLTTVNPKEIRFRAVGLQAELGRLRDGLPVMIVPPRGGAQALSGSINGHLTIGLEADSLARTIDLIVTPADVTLPNWARPGVSAEMEVVVEQTDLPQLAIPVSAVITDGLEKVIFRRDPKDPDKLIRIIADLGISDGHWVEVQSGLADGDEVVHHGIYELMLASGGTKEKGGHFHADGTFHAGDHE